MSSDFKIDEDNIAGEILQQSSLIYKWNLKLARAKRENEMAKNYLEMKEAEKEKLVRKNPEAFGMEKATDAAVKCAIKADAELDALRKEVIEKSYGESVLWAACRSIEAKKSALENLVRMQGWENFSEPKFKGDVKNILEESGKRSVRNKIRKRSNQDG